MILRHEATFAMLKCTVLAFKPDFTSRAISGIKERKERKKGRLAARKCLYLREGARAHCLLCGKIVLATSFPRHISHKHTGKSMCQFCDRNIPNDMLEDHTRMCELKYHNIVF